MTVQCTEQNIQQLKSNVTVHRPSSNTVLLQSLTLCCPFTGNFMNLLVRAATVNTRSPLSLPRDVSRLLLCGTSPSRTFRSNKAIMGVIGYCEWKAKKGMVEASFLACLVYEGQSTRPLVFCGRASRVGWPAKGVEISTRRTVRRILGGRMSMSVSEIRFGLVFWKLWFRSEFLTCSAVA
jgi:hypothetical protein